MPSLALLLVPLFGAILTGSAVRTLKLFDAEDARRLSRVVFMVAMPMAAFDFMRKNHPPTDIFFGLAIAYGAGLAVASTLTFVISRQFLGLSVREAGAAVFTMTCGNAIFLGIPIALSVPDWASSFLILVLFEGTLCFAIGTALMTWPEDTGVTNTVLSSTLQAAARAFQNPIVIGMLLGIIASMTKLPVPEPLGQFFSDMATIVGPLGLFILGLTATDIIAKGALGPLQGPMLLLPIKLVIFPAITGSLAWILTRNEDATSAAILFTGLPPAVASIVLSNVYGQYQKGVASLVGMGTVLGLGTLTLFLAVKLP